jgi:hypothetical protein
VNANRPSLMRKATEPRSLESPSEAVLRRIRISFIRRASLQHAGRSEDVFVIDLGLSGAFVERVMPLVAGERLEVRFCLPENDLPIVAGCRVAWWQPAPDPSQVPTGAGLEFVDISSADQQRIRDYLAAYYRREPNSRRFVRAGAWNDEGAP